MATLVEKLEKVRETIKIRGRITGDLVAPSGEVCLLGGIGVALVEGYTSDHGYGPFREHGEARDVVEVLLANLPESFFEKSYESTREQIVGEGILDYDDLYDFNDVYADDEAVDKLITDAIGSLQNV